MKRLIMRTVWPAFLIAIVAEGFFFSVFDPHDDCLLRGGIELTPLGVYTAGFFCFWAFCSLASMLTYYLTAAPNESSAEIRVAR